MVITRAADQAGPLVDKLIALGARPIVVPLIEIVQPADGGSALTAALGRLSVFDWLVFTSLNGASRAAGALAALAREVALPRIAAVGSATAAALGQPADLVPSDQIAEALTEAFPVGSGDVLVVQAETARSDVAGGLRAKGWRVEVVAAYRTVPVRPSAATLIGVLSADAVLFASGSAVAAWAGVFGAQTPPVAVAIGPATAAVATQHGLKIDAIATDHSLDGLISSLLRYFGGSD